MLFNSYIFIFLFLPLCLLGYYGLARLGHYQLSNATLFAMSLWFYGYNNPRYLLIIIGSMALNFLAYKLMGRFPRHKRKVMIAAVVINLLILMYFKYMDFFISTCNTVFKTNMALLSIALPLGISFFTFQQISFVVDAYKGQVENYSLLEYACFVTFFPQLVAGPIVTHDELVPQLQDKNKKQFNWDNFSLGIMLFTLGLGKKVLLADTFGLAVAAGYGDIASLNSIDAIVVILAYTLQIYFDFSGYCDMAIGLGHLFNIKLPVNFNSPYKARSIKEFWDRWHMTLTRFFTRYVYIPLGGSRRGTAITYRNIFIVFLLSGFWHGAGFTFILWGIGHGLVSIIYRATKSFWDRLPGFVNWFITFILVNVLWVFFRAESISQALSLLKRVITGGIGPISSFISQEFNRWEIDLVVSKLPVIKNMSAFDLMLITALGLGLLFVPNSLELSQKSKWGLGSLLIVAIIAIWSILSFTGVHTFLYFNF